MSAPVNVGDYLEQFTRAVIAEALTAADAKFWLRRAEEFAKVGTPACDEIAQACRNRARLSEFGGDLA